MRVRENHNNLRRSMATTVRLEGRAQLLRYLSGKLRKSGVAIADDTVHVTHYGYDDRTGWDEYIIVVEGFGVFGYADEPCPAANAPLELTGPLEVEIALAEPAQRRRLDLPAARSARAAPRTIRERQAKTACKTA